MRRFLTERAGRREPIAVRDREFARTLNEAGRALLRRSEVGFVFKSEPVIVCLACQCPRGDTAVVIPADTTSTQRVASLGFSPLQ